MKSNVGFWFVLILSVVFVAGCFTYAAEMRESNLIGGEVFTIALPVFIVWTKISEAERENQKLKSQNEAYKKALWQDMR